jgi:hypothetical protein
VKAEALYNPGLVTVVPWIILGIWYIVEVNPQNLIATSDWWIAVGYLVGFPSSSSHW